MRPAFAFKNVWKNKRSHKKKFILSACLMLIMAGFWLHQSPDVPSPPPVKQVEAEIVTPGPIQKTVRLIGTIRPKHHTVLLAKSAGLLDILLLSGEKVKKGDLIAKIINPDIEKNHELSIATENIAKTQYKRFQDLQKTGFVSPREIDEKKQSWIEAEKELYRTKIEQNNLRFYAPFDGIIGAFKIKEGTQVQEAAAVVSIYDPGSLTVEVDIPCTNLPEIKKHQTVIVFNHHYKLNHLQKMIDDETHMCPADVDIQCEHCLIGSTVSVDLVVKEKTNALVIPEQALFLKNATSYVYKIINNKTELTAVKTGIQEKDRLEIVEGLKAFDQVIAKSPDRLSPGLEVLVNSPAKTKG